MRTVLSYQWEITRTFAHQLPKCILSTKSMTKKEVGIEWIDSNQYSNSEMPRDTPLTTKVGTKFC
jgi:hypothetical protein